MNKKLKNLKEKIKDNLPEIALVGAATVATTAYCVYLATAYQTVVKEVERQKATLNEAVDKGYTIWTNSDMSMWYTFEPVEDVEKIKY